MLRDHTCHYKQVAIKYASLYHSSANIMEGEFMAALAFCIDTGRRDLENARMVTIRSDDKGNDFIIAPCDNDFKEGKPPVINLMMCKS